MSDIAAFNKIVTRFYLDKAFSDVRKIFYSISSSAGTACRVEALAKTDARPYIMAEAVYK